jgi:hypothetical protein
MREATARKHVLILELIVSALFLAFGGWLWASALSPGRDPHGMVAGFGNLALLVGVAFLASSLTLFWRSPWAWVVQLLPLGIAGCMFVVLR